MTPAVRRFLAGFVAAAAGAVALGRAPHPAGAAEDPIGKPAQTFAAIDVVGMRPVPDPLAALRGRAVLLVFFGTRYERCADAVPAVNKLDDRHGPAGLSGLWVAEEEREPVVAWLARTGLRAAVALVDTPTRDGLNRHYPVPGYPTAFLVDPDGKIVWTGHPQALKDPDVVPHLAAVSVPPVLPPEIAAFVPAQQKLDAGEWAAARGLLLDLAAGTALDKRGNAWAKGTAAWIERRRPKVLDGAAALAERSHWWDAWEVYDDFPRRFAGMEGIDAAKAAAEAIRKNPAAKLDLEWGDDLAKARRFLAEGKTSPAKLILERLAKLKTTRFGERARAVLATMK